MFYLDVAKVDLDVAYTYMLQAYVSSVSGVLYVCCKCFFWMLHMLAIVFKCFQTFSASVSDACFKCFICLLLYVPTIASGCFKCRSGVTRGKRLATHVQGGMGDVRGGAIPLLGRSLTSPTC